MKIFEMIAEQKIKEAMKNGEFDNLPGAGKPLELELLSNIPEELRVTYKILKNANMLPEEMELSKEIRSLQDLIEACRDDDARNSLTGKLNEKILRFNLMMEKRRGKSRGGYYKRKIYNKFGF